MIIGNESCDLDSMVSTLALAYFYAARKKSSKEQLVIPVLNMESYNFHLRPLNNYVLNKAGIDKKYLTFRY